MCDECSIAFTVEGEDLHEIRIGTRSSPLALAQVNIIAEGIKSSCPNAKIIPVKITTTGDKNMSAFTSDPAGIKSMFTYEIEQALMSGEIDIAIHSLKDMAANINPSLPIVAYSHRGNPFDALILGDNGGNVIGTSSLRRRLQVSRIFPAMKIEPLRGNIGTRLKRLDSGEYSAIVLAACGLERLGLGCRISRIFTPDEIMPAPCQGILACQGRACENYSWLDAVNDEISRDCAIAERSFSRQIGGGCNIPVGAYAVIEGDILTLRGLYVDGDGNILRGVVHGNRNEAQELGMRLAEMITS